MSKNNNLLIPAEVFKPGEHIIDELETRDMSLTDLAEALEWPLQYVEAIIKGDVKIDHVIAEALEFVLRIDAQFFLNLQVSYDAYSIVVNSVQKLQKD